MSVPIITHPVSLNNYCVLHSFLFWAEFPTSHLVCKRQVCTLHFILVALGNCFHSFDLEPASAVRKEQGTSHYRNRIKQHHETLRTRLHSVSFVLCCLLRTVRRRQRLVLYVTLYAERSARRIAVE
jgi:hypothetical protein